jgi:hypothetical protein
MANVAYRLKADTSIPRALRVLDEDAEGNPVYQTEGRNYAEGDVVLANDITPPVRERAENGDLDHLLEPISQSEYDEAIATSDLTFVPEHEAERVVLENAGRPTAGTDVILNLNAQGGEAAAEALETAKKEGRDERPNINADKHEGVPPLGQETDRISQVGERGTEEVEVEGREIPEGVAQTHAAQTAEVRASQNVDQDRDDANTDSAGRTQTRRRRPQAKADEKAEKTQEKSE